MRDMRINRIFEGSTEIMHLLIAREAVDQHLEVAGELLEGDGDLKAKGKSAIEAGKFYSRWLPQLAIGEGQKPGAFAEFGALAGHVALRRARLAQARALDVLRDEPLAGQARAEAGGAGPDRRHRRRALRDLRGGRLRPDAQARSTPSAATRRSSWPTSSAARRGAASTRCSASCSPTTTTPTTRSPSRCSRAATRGSRRASPTRRAMGR